MINVACLHKIFPVFFILLSFSLLASFFTAKAEAESFVVTTVDEFNLGTLTSTEVLDVGSGDGSVGISLAAEVADQSQLTGSKTESFDNSKFVMQTFTAGKTGLLSKVKLSLDRNNSVNTDGNVAVELYTIANGQPSSLLSTATVAASTINRDGQEDVDFSFTSFPALSAGTIYGLIIYRSGSGTITADYNWYRGLAGAGPGKDQYPSGSRYLPDESGTPWIEQTVTNPGTGDLIFTTFVRQYSASGTYSSSVFDSGSSGTEFTSISWEESLSPGTDITFEVRASNDSFAKGDASPSWVSLGSADSPLSLTSFLTSTYRYFQWRATLSGTDVATPTLKDVTLSFLLPSQISQVSSSTPTQTSAIIEWSTDRPSSSRVVYDTVSYTAAGSYPNYGYAFSISLDPTQTTTHRAIIEGLSDGTVYFYRTISEGSPVAVSEEESFQTLTYPGTGQSTAEAPTVQASPTPSPSVLTFSLAKESASQEVLGLVKEAEIDEKEQDHQETQQKAQKQGIFYLIDVGGFWLWFEGFAVLLLVVFWLYPLLKKVV